MTSLQMAVNGSAYYTTESVSGMEMEETEIIFTNEGLVVSKRQGEETIIIDEEGLYGTMQVNQDGSISAGRPRANGNVSSSNSNDGYCKCSNCF